MKIRLIHEDGELRPYVICEGGCDEPVGEDAVVIRDKGTGDVEAKVYCLGCDPGGWPWRSLGEWLRQLQLNTQARSRV